MRWGGAGFEGATDDQLPADVLSSTLALSLFLASGSLVLAVVEGLGPHPIRRLVIGLLFVAAGVGALAARSAVCGWLPDRPWLVVALAGATLLAMALDGLVGSPYVAVSLIPVGMAVVLARARTVWACVALLAAGYAIGVFADRAAADLARAGQLGSVIGALVGYPVVALLLLGVRRQFTWFVANLEPALYAVRHGSTAMTPALGQALRAEPIALLPAPARAVLTPTERRVVEALACGLAPKELAFRWQVSVNTVRKHISNAKRKTGARTLRELAGMPAHPDWTDRWRA